MVTRSQAGYGVNASNVPILPVPILAKTSPQGTNLYYPIGQLWFNQTTGVMYIYLGQGNWPQLASGAAGDVDEIATSSGNALPAAGVITIVGASNQIVSSATGSTVTLTLAGPYTPATYTAHTVLVGEGSSSIVGVGPGTDGQTLIGNTGIDPSFAAIGTKSGLTAHGVVLAEGASAFAVTAVGSTGQVFIGNTGTDPTWSASPTLTGPVTATYFAASADPGSGTVSENILTNANSTTISTGVGSVKMSTANAATNTGWIKLYIGTQVAWIPTWTTNAP